MQQGAEELECVLCKRRFARADSLRRHMRGHAWPEKCRVCGMELKNSTEWAEHLPCTSRGKKRWACTACGSTLASRANLKRHEKTAWCRKTSTLQATAQYMDNKDN